MGSGKSTEMTKTFIFFFKEAVCVYLFVFTILLMSENNQKVWFI